MQNSFSEIVKETLDECRTYLTSSLDIDLYADNLFYIKNIGIDRNKQQLSVKVYLSPDYHLIDEKSKKALAKLILMKLPENCKIILQHYIEKYNITVIDLSLKKESKSEYRSRFTLRVDQDNDNSLNVYQLLVRLGYDQIFGKIIAIENGLTNIKETNKFSIFAIGFDTGQEVINRARCYIGFWDNNNVYDWYYSMSQHGNSESLIIEICRSVGIMESVIEAITQSVKLLSAYNAFLDFMGIDIDCKTQNIDYKFYFRFPYSGSVDSVTLVEKLNKDLFTIEDQNIGTLYQYINELILENYVIDTIAFRINEDSILQYQLYFKESCR